MGLGPGPWDPGTQAPRRRKATLPLPRRPRSKDRMWGAHCGSHTGEGSVLANILFQALREPRGHLAAEVGCG